MSFEFRDAKANVPEDVWRRVNVGAPDECWEWTAGRNHKGYGQMRVKMRQYTAHRLAYFVATGTDPGDLCVLHHCDNPPCCNPAHLFLGTRGDNIRDCAAKGRTLRGERHHQAKLTADIVRAIRSRRAAGELGIDLASEYGVTPAMVSAIHLGKNWRHV